MNFDRFSDPDSLSFNSLSRSSSLIQFESIERQIQTGDSQSFGGSTPSLNNTNTMLDAHARADTQTKSTEHTTTLNSARNYFDIEKIDFNSALYLNCQEQTSSSESSCSTDNSIYYSDHQQDPDTSAKETAFHNPRSTHQTAKLAFRRKNSVENLSEDSGYGDLPSFKCRSKSIPNLNKDQLLFIGIDDTTLDHNHRSLNDINKHSPAKAPHYNGETSTTALADIQRDCQNSSFGAVVGMMGRSKINTNHDSMRSTEHAISSSDTSKNSPNEIAWCTADNNPHVFSAQATMNGRTGASCTDEVSSVHNKNSTSLPDIFAHFASDYGKF